MENKIRRSLSRAYMQAHMDIYTDEKGEPTLVTFISYRSPIISIDLLGKMLYFHDTPVNYSRSTTQQTSCFAHQVLPLNMQYYFLKERSVKYGIKELPLTEYKLDHIKNNLKKVIDWNKNIKY